MYLPEGTTIARTTHVDQKDSVCYYEMQIPPADIGPFFDKVLVSGSGAFQPYSQITESDPRDDFKFGPVPDWWPRLPVNDAKAVTVTYKLNGSAAGYVWIYSPATGKVFMYWFDT